jgi:formylglycine-generating enzyme required for sulfatase activity
VRASKCTPSDANVYPRVEDHPKFPVRGVTWDQAKAYCESKGKRLPTEAEWERAARGTDRRSRPWGDDTATCDRAKLLACAGTGPTDVGTFPKGASPDGVLDLVGNVEEWVADGYTKTYYLESPGVDPKGPTEAIFRTLRGSSYETAAGSEAIYQRRGKEPSFHDDHIGFRCAVSLE